jgi:hypothetical protein
MFASSPITGTSLAVAVEVVRTHHDCLEYIAVIGGALGAVAAVIALFVAIKGKNTADASLDAARSLSEIAKAEAAAARAERARRADPLAMIHASHEAQFAPETDGDVIVTLGFRNDGNRPAERLGVNFLVPAALRFTTCDQYGANVESGKIHFTPETVGQDGNPVEDGPGSFYWSEDVGPIDPWAVNKVQFFRIHKPPFGIYALKVVLMQQDIPGGSRIWAWRLRIPRDGRLSDPDPIGPPVPPMRIFSSDALE